MKHYLKSSLFALLIASCHFGPAFAVTAGDNPFTPYTQTNAIAVSNVASAGIQPSTAGNCSQYKLENDGAVDVWVAFGTAASNAAQIPTAGVPKSSTLVKAGITTTVTQIPNAYISAITASGTANLYVACGVGLAVGVASDNVNVTMGTGTAATEVQGTAATDAPVVGKPLQNGGRASSALPTTMSANGDAVPAWMTREGATVAAIGSNAIGDSDGKTNNYSAILAWDGTTGLSLSTHPSVFNGTTWDRLRGDTAGSYVQGPIATGGDAGASVRPVIMGAQIAGGSTITRLVASANGALALVNNATPSDGISNANFQAAPINISGISGGALGITPYVFNGTTWDRLRGTTNGTQVIGAAANGAAVAGNPVLVAGYDGATTRTLNMDASGSAVVVQSTASNLKAQIVGNVASGSSETGNPVKTGGVYTSNANQPAVTTGQMVNLQADAAGNLRTAPQRPTATDILGAMVSVTSTTASTGLLTVSAGRTWVGTICASVTGSKAAAATGNGEVIGSFLTVGTNVVPAAGTYFQVSAYMGANAATGTAGTQAAGSECTPFTIVAPAGNTVSINYSATCSSTTDCRADFSANGTMQ